MRARISPTRLLRHESLAAARTPYSAQLSPHVVRTVAGDYVQVFRLAGAAFETADDVLINQRHERLAMLWRTLASAQVAVWTHLVRARIQSYPRGAFVSDFAHRLDEKYRARLAGERLMGNALYMSLVYRPAAGLPAAGLPAAGLVTSLAASLIGRERDAGASTVPEAMEACEKLADTVVAVLSPYEPERLGLYQHKGHTCSRVLEFLAFLLNCEWQRIALPSAPLAEVLATSRVSFGVETAEYRTPTQTLLTAMLGVKEYSATTVPGVLDALLSAPFPLVVTQSFAFLTKGASQALLLRQSRRLRNAGDFAISQSEALNEALDALAGNELVFGDHHLTVQVRTDPCEAHEIDAQRQLKSLNERVSIARRLIADAGLLVAREDLALEASTWAQLPGYFRMRARKAPITSRNFAAMSPFHSHLTGRPAGNHWGDALAVFLSTARSPYFFSLHASDPTGDGGSRKDTGHTLIVGPTGSGKTVLIGFLIAMMEKFSATQVVLDKDHGLEVLVRALGGEYRSLAEGVPTGCNPLQLEPTPAATEFLKQWLRVLARGASGRALTARQELDLDQALKGTLALERSARRLSRLLEFLDTTESDGPYVRLSRWCEVTHGAEAHVFDNPTDTLAADLTSHRLIGFDLTAVLTNAQMRVPLALYLMHLIGTLVDGRRLVCWADEFSRLLDDAAFETWAKNALKVWRKLNAVFVGATQSVSDALGSAIARTITEQSATKVLFPSVEAVSAEYMQGLGLSTRECELIRTLSPGARQFIVRQGLYSVVCELPLQGFTAELAVISGRPENVRLMYQLIAEHGAAPAAWLAHYYRHFEVSHA